MAIYGMLFCFDVPVIRIFNKEPELVQTATAVLPLFALSFVPMAYNLIYTAFLFSTKRTGASNVIAASRGIVLKALAIFSIPLIAGTEAIWMRPLPRKPSHLSLPLRSRKKVNWCINDTNITEYPPLWASPIGRFNRNKAIDGNNSAKREKYSGQ